MDFVTVRHDVGLCWIGLLVDFIMDMNELLLFSIMLAQHDTILMQFDVVHETMQLMNDPDVNLRAETATEIDLIPNSM